MKKLIFIILYMFVFYPSIVLGDSTDEYFLKGNMSFDQGMAKYLTKTFYSDDFKKAIEKYDKAIEENPHLIEAWFNKGLAYIRLNANSSRIEDTSGAVYCFRRILEIEPENAEAQFMIGHAYFVIVCSAYGSNYQPPAYTEAKSYALKALNRVIEDFPESEWAKEARLEIGRISSNDSLGVYEQAKKGRPYQIYPRKVLSQ